MKSLAPTRPIAVLCAVLALSSCHRDVETIEDRVLVDLPTELQKNNLHGLPGAVYRHASTSPIHWQPWTSDIPRQAAAADRMIFALVTTVQAPGFAETLDTIAGNRHWIDTINNTYLPVLIDADAAREIGILTADLAAEINQPVNLPFFLWMSPAANPVAWMPVGWIDAESTRDQFQRSHILVSKVWQDSPEYVLNNSQMDNQARYQRISRRHVQSLQSENPAADTARAIRQLISLYDPLSRNYDEVGGLFPSGALDLLASAAMQPDLPPDIRRRADETTRDYLIDLLGSAMFDPLDGGLFAARRGGSWSFPVFHRHSISQSRAASALFRAYQATGNPLALERALGLIEFTESSYQTRDGLFAIGITPSLSPDEWMWTVEQIEQILGPQDGPWWADLTGMRGLGNIPFETDPERIFFRQNTLALGKTLAELAATENSPAEAFTRRFENARSKLLNARNERLAATFRDDSPHAEATFRMVSAYAAAFAATGDDAWREKAVSLLSRSRDAFATGPRLRTFPENAAPAISDARAFTYAIAIHALLDVVEITSDATWLDWCDDLATVMAEFFTDEGFLREVSRDARVIDLPVTDFIMLFGESSLGLVNFAESRLAAIGRPLTRQLRELAGSLPVSAVDFPVQHTDITQAFVSRQFPVTIIYNNATLPEVMAGIERLPLRMFHRRNATPADEIPPGSAIVIRGSAAPTPVNHPDELAIVFLPGAEDN